MLTAGGISAWLLRAKDASGSVEPRIVAVLPFEDSSGRDDTDYLAVALADEIATQLSRLKGVAVPGDWSAQEYRGSSKPTLDIASELGAGAVVRGSIKRTGDDVRLQVDLFDATQNRRVWTREYRGPVNTVLALQRTATDGIASALHLDMTRSERAVLRHVPTASAEAYDVYLRGRAAEIGAASGNVSMPQIPSQPQVENLQRAQSYYARARERDPGFAAPRASLAMLHLAFGRDDRTSARRDQARLEAEAALRLQPGMSQAHEALASYWLLRGDLPNAIAEMERALAGRPNA